MEMTKEPKEYLNFGVDTTGFIRQALAGYVGGNAIASEMMQNADDAHASWLSFRFHPDTLIVRNSSSFTEQDFKNITSIASGGKRDEEEKIGTWGTGFLSVYHLTDKPELLSSGVHLIFDPTQSRIPKDNIPLKKYTEFRLPWRKQETEISQKLNAELWNEEEINGLKVSFEVAIYPLIIFLRNVFIIEVYEKNEKIYAIENRKEKWQTLNQSEHAYYKFLYSHWGIKRQRWTIECNDNGKPDIWLSYHASAFYRRQDFEGLTIKDRTISIAFPLRQTDDLKANFPGILYNFLPIQTQTEFLQTGLPFQINGAFFPNNNRDNILTNKKTQPKHTLWNETVINALGELFVNCMLDIRDQVASPKQFYRILPTQKPKEPFLEPIYETFVEHALNSPIVYNTLGEWKLPREVFISPSDNLYNLSYQYLSILPADTDQNFRKFLSTTLKVPSLKVQHILEYLESYLENGQHFKQSHKMVNSKEKLHKLYQEISSAYLNRRLSIDNIEDLPLCLTKKQTLCLGEDVWRAPQTTRDLLKDMDICFIDMQIQEEFRELFEDWVNEFKGANLVEWLYEQDFSECIDGTIPAIFKNLNHLNNLLYFIADDLENVESYLLAELPLILIEDDKLICCEEEDIYFDNYAYTNHTLQTLGLTFVHKKWANDTKIRKLYLEAGVKDLTLNDVIHALQSNPLDSENISVKELISHLLNFYRYVSSHQLNDYHIETLRNLPICLTQKGQLVSINAQSTSLYLTPSSQQLIDNEISKYLSKLELDYIIHEDLANQGGKSFLKKVLGIRELSTEDFIQDVILRHYHHQKLNHKIRQKLLKYIAKQMYYFEESTRQKLWTILEEADIVYCEEGENIKYKKGREVYFSATILDGIFVKGYPKLHSDYKIPVATGDDLSEAPYRDHDWYWFLKHIKVNEYPNPLDLVYTVKQIVTEGEPTSEQISAIEPIYNLLNHVSR